MKEIRISEVAKLPTSFGSFNIQIFNIEGKEHVVLFTDGLNNNPIVRIHSECFTGEVLKSKKCDCGEQLDFALKTISEKGGMLIYLRQEGRNIGLFNKINAYSLQDSGLNTIEANHQLGFETDERTYEIAEYILEYFNIKKIQLLTNNPDKINSLLKIEITKRLPIIIEPNQFNVEYLKIKKDELGHLL